MKDSASSVRVKDVKTVSIDSCRDILNVVLVYNSISSIRNHVTNVYSQNVQIVSKTQVFAFRVLNLTTPMKVNANYAQNIIVHCVSMMKLWILSPVRSVWRGLGSIIALV